MVKPEGGVGMRFTKMHGIGNDYIYVNCFEEIVRDPSRLAIVMSRAHFGVGSDGLILIEPSDTADFVLKYGMYNLIDYVPRTLDIGFLLRDMMKGI